MKNKTKKSKTLFCLGYTSHTKSIIEDGFMKFLITICYVFIIMGLIASIVIGVATQELISSLASMIILTMFVLLLIFFTIILLAYDIELKQKEKRCETLRGAKDLAL